MFKKLITFFGKKDVDQIVEDVFEEIPDTFKVHIFNNKPIFIDFFKENDAIISFFDNMKEQLETKQWSELSNEDKCYYLSNKLSYYESVINSKEQEEMEVDLLIEEKRISIDILTKNILEKEKNINEILKNENDSYIIISIY